MYTKEGHITTLEPTSPLGFVETPFIKRTISRALTYLNANFPIHFRGPSGIGKTALALRIAEKLGRPVMLIHGDEEIGTRELLGGDFGYKMTKVRDNFIHTVLKIEEHVDKQWADRHLLIAIEHGFTLIYDEFTRSRPEANNVLLPILQEGFISPPPGREGKLEYLQVHPNFRAIFTSNPEEYAGVYRSQDALRDRMITLDLQLFDEETELEIVIAKSNLPRDYATKIVKIVRELRESGQYEFAPTIRASIMIAKCIATMNHGKSFIKHEDEVFRSICFDILGSETSRSGASSNLLGVQKVLDKAIEKFCGCEKEKEKEKEKTSSSKAEVLPTKKILKEAVNENA
ncbi:MAG: gas vesicle protein GvpN [Chlamydiota bacterium]